MSGSLTDVPGIRVGHAQRTGDGFRTGVSVVVPPAGTLGAVDVRGGAPCTLETDALRGGGVAAHPHALVLTGGSAFGLASVQGVREWCRERGLGFPVGPARDEVVPVVPAAAIFDLGRGGRFGAVPDAALGRAAALDAEGPLGTTPRHGRIGAGTGATVDDESGQGGVGGASVTVEVDGREVVVAALAVVNAYGRPDVPYRPFDGVRIGAPAAHTTLVVVATSARVERALLGRLAVLAHDGLARALDPVHTLADGDTVFALSTGQVELPSEGVALPELRRWRAAHMVLQQGVAEVAAQAVRDAVLSA